MLDRIHLKNFKCFKDQIVPLSPLTLLTGLNGSGKSSVIQAMLALKQSIDATDNEVHLNGYWTTLGSINDVYSFFDQNDGEISIEVGRKDEVFSLSFSPEAESPPKFHGNDPDFMLESLENFSYLCADRWGPRVALPMDDQNSLPRHVGKHGEFAIHFLTAHGQSRISNTKFPSHPGSKSRLLEDEITAWLGEVSPGARITTQVVPQADFAYSTFSFPAGQEVTREFRATNVGFGLSYSLPVIIALISAHPGSLVIIENPEAHLHPAGQTAMGRLISMAASAGVQVIIETHSDHVLDGTRIAVKNGIISHNKVSINFFNRGDTGESIMTSPKIDADGMIDEWPDNFFDQSIINLAELGSPRQGDQ